MSRANPKQPDGRSGPASTVPLLRRIAADPAAPLVGTVVGPGGTGKSAVLDAVVKQFRQAGVEVQRYRAAGLLPEAFDPARPVLVDDAHRLGERHLELIRTVLDHPAPRLVLAHRPWPRPNTLKLLALAAPAHRVTHVVSHLDRSAVAARLSRRLGVTPPDGLVELVHEQTGGLPALVDLVGQALCDAGRFDVHRPQEFRRPARVEVSATLAERMRHHVDALEPRLQALLVALAIGAPVDLEVLRELIPLEPERSSSSAELSDTVQAAMATGLVTETGEIIPIVRGLMLRLTPLLRRRELQHRLARLQLDRGGPVLDVGRMLLGTGSSGARAAAVFSAAADEAATSSPTLAGELLDAAVQAGAPPLSVAGRRAYAAALAGDLDLAVRSADQAIADHAAPDQEAAMQAAATALTHRGLPASSAELLRCLPAGRAALAVPPLLGTGALAEARAMYQKAQSADGPASLLDRAAVLLAGGLLESVDGVASSGLSQLARAAVLLEPVAVTTLLPDTPAALTALVAMHHGEPAVAESTLRRAINGRHGGRPAQLRHQLLYTWLATSRGRPNGARKLLATIGDRLEPREELLAAALAIGLARRDNDTAALTAAAARARGALVENPVDLYSLPQLGECAVAAARLGEPDWVAPHLAEAATLLDELGRPPLWTAPLHWCLLHAAAAAEDVERVIAQSDILQGLATAGAQQGALAIGAASWAAVLAGDIDQDAVQQAARRLHAAGMVWEAGQLAGQAAQRTTDRRAALAMQACARTLTGAPEDDPDASPDQPEQPAADPAGEEREQEQTKSVLSERELEIGSLVLAGLTYKQIGEQLFISAKTVEHHVARMRDRLGVTSRNDLFGRLRALV